MLAKSINFLKNIILPTSKEDDDARVEFILNILLTVSIILVSLAFIINFLKESANWNEVSCAHNNVSSGTILIILFFLFFLFYLSKKGFYRIVACLLIGIFFLLASSMSFRWGVDVNAGLLFYALTIVMSGILLRAYFAFLLTVVIALTIVVMDYLQRTNVIQVDRYWRSEKWLFEDTLMMVVIFLIIATVSWLSNREIEKSLKRARKSEAELKKERDSLEIKVEERTREIREMEAEKMIQLYRFAELGRLSSGLFHDLVNPLNSLSLSMEKMKHEGENGDTINKTKAYSDSAFLAARKMEDMIVAVRRQISKQENNTIFSVDDEIKQAIRILAYKAQKAGVEILFSGESEIKTFGDATKLNQVALNLIANAIESYLPDGSNDKAINNFKKVDISLKKENDSAVFVVSDFGAGIPEENFDNIFEPFFSTKNGSGMGIGLSVVKRIIEKDFGGKIDVESAEGMGTVFTVTFKMTAVISELPKEIPEPFYS